MLNELVDHIEVHQAEKIDGEWVQKLTIHYNCVGALFIPDTNTNMRLKADLDFRE